MNKKDQKVLFSHDSDEYETSQDLFDYINKIYRFGVFTLDPAATDENHKCDQYYTKEDDGLDMDWANEIVFVNPPYSQLKAWCKKAYEESKKGKLVVMLIPSRTDTIAWHEYCMKAKEIVFIKGRLKFGNSNNSAPFPSAIIVFDERKNADTL